MLGDLSKRMKDQELVLRFWAFYRFDYLDPKNKKEISSFLDKAMEDIKKGDDVYRAEFQGRYLTAIERCLQLLGEKGFEKNPASRRRSKNATLFEVWMVMLVKLTENEFGRLVYNQSEFQNKVQTLLKDAEFINVISYSTQRKEHVEIRYEKVNALIKEMLND